MMRPMFNPLIIGSEIIFSIAIVLLCLLIYFKTKEAFKLTKHPGISYFRNTFLFLALAYFFRLVLTIFLFSRIFVDVTFPRHFIMPIFMVFISFSSTMAIFSLFLSTSWKQLKLKNANLFAALIALVISVSPFFSRGEPFLLIFAQALLLLLTAVFYLKSHKEFKKFPKLFTIYILLFLLWIFALVPLGSKRLFPHEFVFIGEVISLVIFAIIFYKVNKWIK